MKNHAIWEPFGFMLSGHGNIKELPESFIVTTQTADMCRIFSSDLNHINRYKNLEFLTPEATPDQTEQKHYERIF
ncbi:MAG: hypothetical protein C0490_15475 [Marivirga sp.]|nr:hypothetical protein [Marivirga sp.]